MVGDQFAVVASAVFPLLGVTHIMEQPGAVLVDCRARAKRG
jgi:hypothetical protein